MYFKLGKLSKPGGLKVSEDSVGRFHPFIGHKGPLGEQRYSSTLFLTSALEVGEGVSVTSRPCLTPGERPGTHCTGGWAGLRAGLDRGGKSRPPPGFDPRIVQPVRSRYTDWATPAHEDSEEASLRWCEIIAAKCSMNGTHEYIQHFGRITWYLDETWNLLEQLWV
jgi:hypothetical protein